MQSTLHHKPLMIDSGSNLVLGSILLSTSAGSGIGTALSERIKQYADVYSFLFAQLDMPANVKR